MSRQLKIKKGVQYYYLEWGHEPVGFVTVWYAGDDDGVHIVGHMEKAAALAAGAKFSNPYP